MTCGEDKAKSEERYPAVWHLLWIVPGCVALIYGFWEYMTIHYMSDISRSTISKASLIRDIFVAFMFTLIAIYLVMRDRKERVKELKQSLAELREMDDMKNNFLSNVSHELRTPLTTVNGYVKFMLSKGADDLSSKQTKYLKIMSEECDRLKHYIEELLFITTLESRPMYVEYEDVNLEELVSTIRQNLRVKAEQKGLKITTFVKKGLTAKADKERLYQLITNLIDNSIKYTGEGGRIKFTIRRSEKDINIQVIDSGIGIPEDMQEKVFERFYQVDSSVSREHGGTGLGLAICRVIVGAFKGSIRITSPLPKKELKGLGLGPGDGVVGTKFDICIPLDYRDEDGDL